MKVRKRSAFGASSLCLPLSLHSYHDDADLKTYGIKKKASGKEKRGRKAGRRELVFQCQVEVIVQHAVACSALAIVH